MFILLKVKSMYNSRWFRYQIKCDREIACVSCVVNGITCFCLLPHSTLAWISGLAVENFKIGCWILIEYIFYIDVQLSIRCVNPWSIQ